MATSALDRKNRQGTPPAPTTDPNKGFGLPTPSAIGIEDLKTTDASAPTFPVVPPPTQTDGMLGSLEAMTDSFTQGLKTRAEQSMKGRDLSFDALLKSLTDTETSAGLEDSLYSETVDPAEAEVRRISNEMLTEQQGLKRRVQEIEKNKRGLFGGALEQAVQEAKDESLARQADQAVLKLAAVGEYDSAKAIADRAVAAKLEAKKQRNELLTFVYGEYKDLFTEDEARLFETEQKKRDRALDMEEKKEMARYEEMLYRGRPTSGGGIDPFKDDEIREVSRAGLGGAPERVQAMFAEAPAGFRSAYILNGFGNAEVTPEILRNNIAEWETANAGKGNADAELLRGVIEAARNGG